MIFCKKRFDKTQLDLEDYSTFVRMHLKLAQVKNPADPLKEKLLKIVEKLQNDLAEVKKENAELKVKIGDLTMELGNTKTQVKLAYFFKCPSRFS